MSRSVVLLLAALLVLAGCSSDDSTEAGSGTDTSASPSPSSADGSATPTPVPTGPDCASVWAVGDVLPDDYEQCVADGAVGVQDVVECADGPPLVVFENELYGRPGEEVRASDVSPVQDTEEFAAAYSECTGD